MMLRVDKDRACVSGDRLGIRVATERSRELDQRMMKSMPGGNTRTQTFFPPYPLTISHGRGCCIWDVDGNEFLDLLNNYTSLIHGHADPRVVDAVTVQARSGTAFPAPGVRQAELAELICGRIDSVEAVRFTNSGTEAVMQAVKVARAFTKRAEIVKIDGGYHGSWEQLPPSKHYFEGLNGYTIPDAVRSLLHMVPMNDVAHLTELVEQRKDKLAAILIVPVLGDGIVCCTKEFVVAARELCDRHGIVLILDEIITARLHIGGYQAVLGVRPDLTTLGKIFGGGLPVGALGGRADILSLFDPRAPAHISHPGTFNGNPMTMAAGCATIKAFTESEIERLAGLGARLGAGLQASFDRHGVAAFVSVCGSLLHTHLGRSEPVTSWDDVWLGNPALDHFHRLALEEGIYMAPRGLIALSTPMDDEIIDIALSKFDLAVQRLNAELPRG